MAWLGEFEPGQFVQSRAGELAVASIQALTERPQLYNVEVDGEHVYEVATIGILVHNAGTLCEEIRRLTALQQQGPLSPENAALLAKLEAEAALLAPNTGARLPRNAQEALEVGLTERDPQWPFRGLHEAEGHHPLMQGEKFREFWKQRGLSNKDVEGFIEDLDTDIHRAVSEAAPGKLPWWDQQLLRRIADREAVLGRLLTKAEVLEEAAKLLDLVKSFSP